jgi:hypothetical protein
MFTAMSRDLHAAEVVIQKAVERGEFVKARRQSRWEGAYFLVMQKAMLLFGTRSNGLDPQHLSIYGKTSRSESSCYGCAKSNTLAGDSLGQMTAGGVGVARNSEGVSQYALRLEVSIRDFINAFPLLCP